MLDNLIVTVHGEQLPPIANKELPPGLFFLFAFRKSPNLEAGPNRVEDIGRHPLEGAHAFGMNGHTEAEPEKLTHSVRPREADNQGTANEDLRVGAIRMIPIRDRRTIAAHVDGAVVHKTDDAGHAATPNRRSPSDVTAGDFTAAIRSEEKTWVSSSKNSTLYSWS
jgi:hypothetical protein